MLGNLITRVRKDRHITKVELAKRTGINIGHISHIEKGERNPSHKALRAICKALDVPFEPMMYTYDKEVGEEQKRYRLINHISYTGIPLVNDIDSFIDLPAAAPNCSIAIKIKTDEMEPLLKKGDICYIEMNAPLESKDIALVEYEGKIMIRRFIVRKDKLSLRAENKEYKDINFNEYGDFTIIGKVHIV